jgi:hypothetical protein
MMISGAKHKQKEHDKAEGRSNRLSQSGLSGDEVKNGKGKDSGTKGEEKGKKSKKKKEIKGVNGEAVKRPLSAYMLYNNFRRPVLQ